MTPEIREFLNLYCIALKIQPVEQGVYHRGFIAYNTNTPLREMSTQTFCAIVRAIRNLNGKTNSKYVDNANNVVVAVDGNSILVRYGKNNRFDYYVKVSSSMMQQLAVRQEKSNFRWIRRIRNGYQIITKYGVSND